MLIDPHRVVQRWERRFAGAPSRSRVGQPKPRALQRAKTDYAAAQMLADASYFPGKYVVAERAMFYRKARVADYSRSDDRVVQFAIHFQKLLAGYCYPLVPWDFGPWEVRFWHCARRFDLSNREWRVVARVAEEAAFTSHSEMVWGGAVENRYDPTRWVLRECVADVFIPWRGYGSATEADYDRCNEVVNVAQLRVDALSPISVGPKGNTNGD